MPVTASSSAPISQCLAARVPNRRRHGARYRCKSRKETKTSVSRLLAVYFIAVYPKVVGAPASGPARTGRVPGSNDPGRMPAPRALAVRKVVELLVGRVAAGAWPVSPCVSLLRRHICPVSDLDTPISVNQRLPNARPVTTVRALSQLIICGAAFSLGGLPGRFD